MQFNLVLLNVILSFKYGRLYINYIRVLLIFLLIVYGLFSSSTPDQIGLAEFFIAMSLISISGKKGIMLSVPGGILLQLFKNLDKIDNVNIYNLLFLYLFLTGTLVGIIRGNEIYYIIRDVIPLIYFFLPIFILHRFRKNIKDYFILLLILFCFVGVAFSIRHFGSLEHMKNIGKGIFFGSSDYFVMDPFVIFSATFLLNYGLLKFVLSTSYKNTIFGLALMFIGLIPFSAIIATVVRAQILLLLLSLVFSMLLIISNIFKPSNFSKFKIIKFFSILMIILYISYTNKDTLENIVNLLNYKFQAVGLNARDEELKEVIIYISSSTLNFLVGSGWGGEASFSTGGSRFTHSAINYFLFKTGVIGLIIVLVYIMNIFRYLFWGIRNSFIKKDNMGLIFYIATLNAIFINTFIEAGYKMLSYGFIITAIILISMEVNNNDKS